MRPFAIHLQVHAAEQEQRVPENLLGVVSRVWKVQVGPKDVGNEKGGKSIIHNSLLRAFL